MTRFEQRWARDVLRAFAPAGNAGLAPGPNEVDYLGCLQRMRRVSTPLAALGLRLGLWLVAWAPLWSWGRLTTIRGLPGPRRSALLGELLRHRWYPVRELTTLLKLAASFALLGTPSVRARSGYAPRDPHATRETRRLRVIPAASEPPGVSLPPADEEAS